MTSFLPVVEYTGWRIHSVFPPYSVYTGVLYAGDHPFTFVCLACDSEAVYK